MQHDFVMGEKKNWTLLYIVEEKQFYSLNANGAKGKIYRCLNRNCKCRALVNDDKVVRFNTEQHNHNDDSEERYKKLKVLELMKNRCSDLSTIASGKRMMKTRDIYKQVINNIIIE